MLEKIYYQGKPLFIVDEVTKEIEEHLHHEETIFIDEFNLHTIKTMIHELESEKILRGVFLHHDVQAVVDAFRKKLELIQAAGGLVVSPDEHVLMIFRRGKWDLPKGKLDSGEDLETCAVREVKEETGISEISIERFLCLTFHTYEENRKKILKESHWYLMKAASKEKLEPQVEEDISECTWVKKDELDEYLNNTHPSIRDVIETWRGGNIRS
jgi:8-oxo-dGTP pyrophosphatase MutT (NUDIX family)